MRLHQTYLLRLWIDTEAADPGLHGSLQAIDDQQTYSFKSAQALLVLLKGLVQAKSEAEQITKLFDQEYER